MHGVRRIPIKGDFIRLDALLKFASIASTGGEAKIIIQNGEVRVGKNICTERGKKIRHGDIVRIGAETLVVKCKNVPTAEGQKKSDDR
ncbi:MAG: RNA-binding S4 domain-containing protein [Oscillospiraceae bacterium]|nr:RNA-binding S4 domain-containing protein [Oscillospiraceae bacterium]